MTALWTSGDLSAALGITPPAFDADGVSIDSRTLRPGDLFVALIGTGGDGHAHVEDALARGAAGAMVHRAVPGVPPKRLMSISDTLVGLHALGRHARARSAARFVAVTGSVGKTTTKEMLRTALAAFGPVHASDASYNNHWGVPLTLARLPRGATFAVIEIGMNQRGEIAPLARLARPHVAVVTAVGTAHIGNLGSIEAIAEEKGSILAGLEPGGAAVLPADSPFLPILDAQVPGGARVLRFGASTEASARLLHAVSDPTGCDMDAEIDGVTVRLRLAAPGRHMAMNATAALCAARALGLDAAAAAAALNGFAAVTGRGARRALALPDGTVQLLDESYNASPAAVRAALAVLALQPGPRRIAMLGDMLELGESGPSEHAALAEDAALAADLVFTCGPLMHHLFSALPPARRGAHAPDAASLAPLIIDALRPGDAVLVKGSLGSRMKIVVQALEALAARASAA